MTDAPPTLEWRSQAQVRATQHRTMQTLVITQIVGGVGVGAAASIGALLAQAVAHSETYAGLARTASTLGAALFGLPLARLAARHGRRRALGSGWLIAAGGGAILVAAAAAHSITLLIVGMLMFGSGNATNLQSRFAATDLAAPDRRAVALSVAVWATTIGAVAGPNLAGPGGAVGTALHLPRLAGGFAISAVCLFLAGLVLIARLRPDPLLTARRHEPRVVSAAGGRAEPEVTTVLRLVWSHTPARLAFVAIVLGNTVMAAIMTMTPVDMADHGASLTIVGITISGHVLGMFGFAPVVGWLSNRLGRVPVLVLGQAIFVISAVLAGAAHGSVALVSAGLFLLGLGWSFAVVAGSALLGESVPADVRPVAQGAADTTMNMVAAVAAGVSGPLMAAIGFSGLNVIAGILVIPVLLLLPTVAGPRARIRESL